MLEVRFELTQDGQPTIGYGDVKKFFAATIPTLQQVRDAVRSIRQSKAMLIVPADEDCRSAGSFFKNPIVIKSQAARVESLAQKIAPDQTLTQYPAANG